MKRAIWIVAALVLLFTSVAPPATWATPTRDVYDVPNPENSAPGDDDEPGITTSPPSSSLPAQVRDAQPVDPDAVESVRERRPWVRHLLADNRFIPYFRTLIRRLD